MFFFNRESTQLVLINNFPSKPNHRTPAVQPGWDPNSNGQAIGEMTDETVLLVDLLKPVEMRGV